MAGKWRTELDSNSPSLLPPLGSQLLYVFVVLLITTNFSGLSFLRETRLDRVSYLLLKHSVLQSVLPLLKHSLQFYSKLPGYLSVPVLGGKLLRGKGQLYLPCHCISSTYPSAWHVVDNQQIIMHWVIMDDTQMWHECSNPGAFQFTWLLSLKPPIQEKWILTWWIPQSHLGGLCKVGPDDFTCSLSHRSIGSAMS